jgi:hypothetical protein
LEKQNHITDGKYQWPNNEVSCVIEEKEHSGFWGEVCWSQEIMGKKVAGQKSHSFQKTQLLETTKLQIP